MLGTFVSKTIPRSAKAVCSCTILCLNLKTVNCTRRGLWDRLFGQGFDSPHLHQQVIESQRCDSFFNGSYHSIVTGAMHRDNVGDIDFLGGRWGHGTGWEEGLKKVPVNAGGGGYVSTTATTARPTLTRPRGDTGASTNNTDGLSKNVNIKSALNFASNIRRKQTS